MAKTIKFNLICDGNPVRNLEDLQNNFSIEDILAYYNNKLLHRWLKVRGYEKELEAVNEIIAEKNIDIIKSLISIFGIDLDKNDVAENVYILDYLDERKGLYSIYEQESFKVKNILDDYQAGYIQLVNNIIENPDNVALIKTSINEIVSQYPWIFELNHRAIFYKFYDTAPLAIFILLANEKTRGYYLPVVIEQSGEADASPSGTASLLYGATSAAKTVLGDASPSGTASALFGAASATKTVLGTVYLTRSSSSEKIRYDIDLSENDDKKRMYNKICELISGKNLSEILKNNLKSFTGVTDGYWKDLEEKGKKCMILSMDSGDFVRSAGEKDGDLGCEDIANRFVILDGIDFKCNTSTHKLFYMEV